MPSARSRYLAFLSMLLCSVLLCTTAMTAAAWTPTQADLDTALKSAGETWGYSIAGKIHVDMEPLNPCRANADQSATVNVETTATTTTTQSEPDAPPVVSTTYTYTYTIHVNANCKWSPAWLDNVLTHEYGHLLIGVGYHSKDPRSIMYWAVKDHGQSVTPEDRARVPVRPSERGDLPVSDRAYSTASKD